MTPASLRLEPFTKHLFHQWTARLIEIGQAGSGWPEEAFLRELPEKWSLSKTIWRDDDLIGFAILSRRDPPRVHLHEFAVASACQGAGAGSFALNQLKTAFADCGISLKVAHANTRAQALYRKHGFWFGERDGASVWMYFDASPHPA